MGFNCGVVGLPNVGKSTIFNALTSAGAQASNYPFTTIDPNIGIVDMPDERLDRLVEIYKPKKTTPTSMEFVDIAGVVKGAAQGEGLGNKFLANIREVDAIAHVVRCFEDPNVVHVAGKVDPRSDIEVIEAELMLADLDALEKRLFKSEKMVRTGDKKVAEEAEFMKQLKEKLAKGEPVRREAYSEEQTAWLKSYNLLSAKPVLYVANVAENALDKPNPHVDAVKKIAGEKGVPPGTITRGKKAPQAAGKIHSDFEKGFIRAEVFHYDDLMKHKTEQAVKAAGLVRSEGKDYVGKEGDIMLFRFNV